VNEDAWAEMVVAEATAIDSANWRERLEELSRQANARLAAGTITEPDFCRVAEAIDERFKRTSAAAERKTNLRKVKGVVTGGAVGRIVMPMVDQMRPAPTLRVAVSNPDRPQAAPVEMPPDRPRRLARRSNRSPAERFRDRRVSKARERRRQAKLAKIPADLFRDYTVAEAAALSIIVYDIAQAAAGQCRRTYKHIAASAAVCVRSVAEAVAAASYLGLICVEHRKGKSSIITPLDPELVRWLRLLEAHRQTPTSDEIFENKREKRSPHSHAKACMTPSDRDDGSAQEAPPPPPARVGADRRPLPSLGNVARLRVKPEVEGGPTPLEALIARVLPEVEAEDARRQAWE
jgi:hypothetical protein